MIRRWLLNLGLAALIAVLALVVVFKPGTHKTPAIPPLTDLSINRIDHIRLQRPGQPEIDFERSSSRWVMTAPRKARANSFRINELLHLAVAKIATHFAAPAAELGRYGLDKPRAEVWLNDEQISFGEPHPLDPDYYALYRGQVYLVPDHYNNAATAPLSGFFSTRLINIRSRLISLRLPGLTLTRKPDGSWQVIPPNKKLSTDRVNKFVDDWRYAEALSVRPYSGKPVIGHIRIAFAPPATGAGHQTVAIGKPPSRDQNAELNLGILERKSELILYRKDEDLEYHFPADMAAQLLELKPH